MGYFKGISIGKLAGALKRLGFAGVSETAIGAQLVSAQTAELLDDAKPGGYLSSACPAAVDFIRKYYPQWTESILPVVSPVMAHCKLLRKTFGNDIKTIFIGPCAAKKNEADRNPDELNLAITFAALESWLKSAGVTWASVAEEPLVPSPAEEGRLYSIEGGMNDTLRDPEMDSRLIAVSGLPNISRMIEKVDLEALKKNGTKMFIELACDGGCVNGPVMERGSSRVDVLLETASHAPHRSSLGREVPVDIRQYVYPDHLKQPEPDEAAIQQALEKIGKFSAEDELNCGSCGYNTCREKAIAVLQGKAEISMCLPYLKDKAESFSDCIVNNTPNGLFVLNENLEVQQINAAARKIMNLRSASDILGEPVVRIMDPAVFLQVLSTKRNVRDQRIYLAEYKKYVEETVVYDATYHLLICIMRDVTDEETEREKKENISRQTIEIADKVVDKQMRVVQEIASLLGETAAETKIALTKLKESIDNE